MGKDKSKKKHKKDSKKKNKKDSKDKKRRRDEGSSSSDYSSDSDSDRDYKKQKSEKLAQKVVAHIQKTAKGPDAPFVWGKKVEKEISEGKKLKEISLFSDRNRAEERLEELEKVRKRQAEREAEKARREEELSMIQRMRAAQEAMESEAKEEEFYLQNLLNKAERRLRDNRPHPSDLIARNLHVGLRLGDSADFNHKEPWKYFEGLQLDDTEALADDIREYAEYDKFNPLHAEFWKALVTVSQMELAEARKRDAIDRAHLKGGPEAAAAVAAQHSAGDIKLHHDVEQDVHNMLRGQSYGELCVMEASIQTSLEKGEGDAEYWQAVLQRLKIYKAKAHVRDIQSRIIAADLQRQAQEAAEQADEEESEAGSETEFSDEELAGGTDSDLQQRQGRAGAGEPSGSRQQGFGAGTAVARAMGWFKEARGVVRAEGAVPGADTDQQMKTEAGAPQQQEEEEEQHPLLKSEEGDEYCEDEDDEAGGEGEPVYGAGHVSAGVAAAAAPDNPEEIDLDDLEAEPGTTGPKSGGAIGPAPANVVYPQELPGFRRRQRRRKGAGGGGDGPDPGDEARRVGGDTGDLPDEAIADGTMSPVPLDPRVVKDEEVVHEEDDYRELELLRQQAKLQTTAAFRAARSMIEESGPSTQDRSVRALLRDSGRVGVHPMMRHIAASMEAEDMRGFRAGIPDATLSSEDQAVLAQFKNAALKNMGNDGADRDFGGEVPLDAQVYWWHDKYKPRKPKYFNRVHTGYEWNKYNQTHYDYDNPPPKVVQGYKFNILYHDLIDKKQTPTYVIERDPTSTDNSTCIIRFIAGPPYEDIAFRIVNKEWNYARKHGFRCSFERGILHLFFNFKRTRYRR